MSFNWRPDFHRNVVRRELQIIRDDLHANAVRICGLSLRRLKIAADEALQLGLEVWLSPEMWDKSPDRTLAYIATAAAVAEELRARYSQQLFLIIGSEFTLFMPGIVEGRNLAARMGHPSFIDRVRAGDHNPPLNRFLAEACSVVGAVFRGQITYASLPWECVDWGLFDFVGVDHYRSARNEDRYADTLRQHFAHGKPVLITEFGYATCQDGIGGSGGFLASSGLGADIVDARSQYFHFAIPFVGRFIRPRVRGVHTRDERWQARRLVEHLGILDAAGVDGAFVFQFISQMTPCDDDPLYDVDTASTSLVKYFEHGFRGTTYPDMKWQSKESFHVVADHFARTPAATDASEAPRPRQDGGPPLP